MIAEESASYVLARVEILYSIKTSLAVSCLWNRVYNLTWELWGPCCNHYCKRLFVTLRSLQVLGWGISQGSIDFLDF
jgi:hypothetical protein